jgi:voltage-gated potassium channel
MDSHNFLDAILTHAKRPPLKRESRKIGFILYECFYGLIIFLKAVYRQLLILIIMILCGTAIFSYYNALQIIPAFLASVSMITTLGFYAPSNVFAPGGGQEAILLIIIILVSFATVAWIVQSIISAAIDTALAKGEAMKRLISRLKNHGIVYGYAHLGRYVVNKLDEIEVDYVVITPTEKIYQNLLNQEILTIFDHGLRPIETLKEAGIERASFIVAAHHEDPNNLMFVLSARKLRPDIKIITVVHDEDLVETAKSAGADVVIPSTVTVGHLLALSAITNDLVGVVFSEKLGTKEIAQFSVFKTSSLIGQPLEEIAKYASIIGIIRGDTVQNIFTKDFAIQENDTILVLGDPKNLELLEKNAKAI